jgi:hypothetical protein
MDAKKLAHLGRDVGRVVGRGRKAKEGRRTKDKGRRTTKDGDEGERRKEEEKGERRKKKGERRKEKGERRKEKGLSCVRAGLQSRPPVDVLSPAECPRLPAHGSAPAKSSAPSAQAEWVRFIARGT